MEVVIRMGKVKCSGVYLSPVHRKAKETSGSLVISLEQEEEPDLPCPVCQWGGFMWGLDL